MAQREQLDFIQGARGVAAMLVVLWHASRFLGPYGTGIGGALFIPAGPMGVDLFFLISGFIMVFTTASSDASPRYVLNFFIKRVTRVFPTYAIATLVFVLFRSGSWGGPDSWLPVFRALMFLPLGAGGDANVAPVFGQPPLPVGWTLNYEMYFYLIFGVSLLFGRLRWAALFLWMAATLLVLPFLTAENFTLAYAINPGSRQSYMSYIDLVTNPIIYDFLFGALIGLLYFSNVRIGSIFYCKLLIALSIAALIWQYASHSFMWSGIGGAGVTLIPAVAIMCIASKTITIPCPRWLVGLGAISYSLYLWHPFVQEGYSRVMGMLGVPSPAYDWPALVMTTILSIAVAAVSHRYLELYLSNAIRDTLFRLTAVGARRRRRTV